MDERRDLYEQKRVLKEYSQNKIEDKNIFHSEVLLRSITSLDIKNLTNIDFIEKDGVKYIIAGIISYWIFPNCIFIEHIAISTQLQGLGIGKVAIDHIKSIQENYKTPIILEIEIPVDHITKRRESFYKRLGFKSNEVDHFQPPFHLGDDPIEMVIMSYPKEIGINTYLEFKDYQIEIMPNF